MRSRYTFLALFLHLIIFISILFVGWNYYRSNLLLVQNEAKRTLNLEANIKKTLIDKLFVTTETEISFLSKNGNLKLALDTLKTAWSELGENPTKKLRASYVDKNPFKDRAKLIKLKSQTNYNILHEALQEFFYNLKVRQNYHNIFLMDMDGNVLYDVIKSRFFAQNIDKYKGNISEIYKELKALKDKNEIAFRDFSKKEGAFFGAILSDERDEEIGILAIEVQKKRVDSIAQLKRVTKESCKDIEKEDKESFRSTTCLNYKDNFWEISIEKSSKEIYKNIKLKMMTKFAWMVGLGLLSLLLGYLILWQFLGRVEDDEDE